MTARVITTDNYNQMRKNSKPYKGYEPIVYQKYNSNLFHIKVNYEDIIWTNKQLIPLLPENLPLPARANPITFNIIIQKLNDFLKRRPTLEALKKEGIIKGSENVLTKKRKSI